MEFKNLVAILTTVSIFYSCASLSELPYDIQSFYSAPGTSYYDYRMRQMEKINKQLKDDIKQIKKDVKSINEVILKVKKLLEEIIEPCINKKIKAYMKEGGFMIYLFENPDIIDYIAETCIYDFLYKNKK